MKNPTFSLLTIHEAHEATKKDYEMQMMFAVMEENKMEAMMFYKMLAKFAREAWEVVPFLTTNWIRW